MNFNNENIQADPSALHFANIGSSSPYSEREFPAPLLTCSSRLLCFKPTLLSPPPPFSLLVPQIKRHFQHFIPTTSCNVCRFLPPSPLKPTPPCSQPVVIFIPPPPGHSVSVPSSARHRIQEGLLADHLGTLFLFTRHPPPLTPLFGTLFPPPTKSSKK